MHYKKVVKEAKEKVYSLWRIQIWLLFSIGDKDWGLNLLHYPESLHGGQRGQIPP